MKIKSNRIFTNLILISYIFFAILYIFLPWTNINAYLSTRLFIAQAFAFPRIVALIMTIFILLLFFLPSKKRLTKTTKVIYLFSLILSILLFFSGLIQNINNRTSRKDISPNEQIIRIVSWNALNSDSEESFDYIFKKFNADITILPEFGGYQKGEKSDKRVNDIIQKLGLDTNDYQIFTSYEVMGDISPVTIITKKSLDEFKELKYDGTHTLFGLLRIESQNKNIKVIGLHTAPPIPTLMKFWRDDIENISTIISQFNTSSIIAGDFNATYNHGKLSQINTHFDALNSANILSRGTWPVKLPPILGSEIDHILLPNESYQIKNSFVKELKGSDHRAVFTEVYKVD